MELVFQSPPYMLQLRWSFEAMAVCCFEATLNKSLKHRNYNDMIKDFMVIALNFKTF